MYFVSRQDAGQQLGRALRHFGRDDVVILALPRGGVVIGAEVARTLLVPLGLVLVRKIGHPNNPEYAIGAIAEDQPAVYDEREAGGVSQDWLKRAETDARKLIEDRRKLYYSDDFTPPKLKGKVVILADDGIATGLTVEAAVRAISQQQPKKIVVAVPVAPSDSVGTLKSLVDEVIVLDKPKNFLGAVGAHYQRFEQVDDKEVKALLREVQDDLL